MNATLTQNEIDCWEMKLHTTLNREETLEMIVPDACPDILDIVDTEAAPQLQSKECGMGSIALMGTAFCTILYQPEGEGRLQRLKAELPFQFSAELEQVTGLSRCIAVPRVTLAETRAMNPRKVLVRVVLAIEVTVYDPVLVRFCTEIQERETLGIECRSERSTGNFVVNVKERPFTCSEVVQIPGSRPPVEELLSVRCRAYDSEARLVGEKLIFKGGAVIHLLYLSPEGQLSTADFELPFSQIAEVGETAENTSFQLDVMVTGCQARAMEPEGREVSLELELLAQIVLREKRELNIVADAYSIFHPGTPEFTTYVLPELVEQSNRRQNVREVLDTAMVPAEVCDVRVQTGQVRPVGGELCAEIRMTVLYRGEDGTCAAAARSVQVTCPAEVPEGAQCVASCTVPESDASVTGGGIEVRLGVEFQMLVTRQQRLCGLSGFALDMDQAVASENQPSIVLRQLGEGETLWDIAKAYLTTGTEIEQANGLGTEPLKPGQMLLIPKKR